MNAWLLLAVFAAFYVLLMVAGVAFWLGERREARRAAELVEARDRAFKVKWRVGQKSCGCWVNPDSEPGFEYRCVHGNTYTGAAS